jgi:hypothetical protein
MFVACSDVEAAVRAERSASDAAAAWASIRDRLDDIRDELDLPADSTPGEIKAAFAALGECEAVLDGFQRPLICGCVPCQRYGGGLVAAAAGLRAEADR